MKHRITNLTVLAMLVAMVGYSGAASAQAGTIIGDIIVGLGSLGRTFLDSNSGAVIQFSGGCMYMPNGHLADNGDDVWFTARGRGCDFFTGDETDTWDYHEDDHTLRLHSRPDKCVSIPPTQMNSNLAEVQLWDCWQGASQKFDLINPKKAGPNDYEGINAKIRSTGGKCLSPMWNKGRMTTWDCEGATEFNIAPPVGNPF